MTAEASIGGPGRRIRWRLFGWGAASVLLLIPLMLNFPWSVSDFVFAAIMFGIVGGTLELTIWRSSDWSYRGAVAVTVAACFLHIWITGAFGIIGNESNPGNLLYLGVVVLVIFGTILSLARAAGMAWVMAAAVVAEILIPPVAWLWVADPAGDVLLPEVFASAIVFTGMWVLAGSLFREAARPA